MNLKQESPGCRLSAVLAPPVSRGCRCHLLTAGQKAGSPSTGSPVKSITRPQSTVLHWANEPPIFMCPAWKLLLTGFPLWGLSATAENCLCRPPTSLTCHPSVPRPERQAEAQRTGPGPLLQRPARQPRWVWQVRARGRKEGGGLLWAAGGAEAACGYFQAHGMDPILWNSPWGFCCFVLYS